MATMTLTFAELTQQIELRVLAEQRIRELEAKLAEVTLNPPVKTRKPAVKKELTPEEAAIQLEKRREAYKKGNEKRLATIARKKIEKEEALREKIFLEQRELLLAESKAKFEAELAAAE